MNITARCLQCDRKRRLRYGLCAPCRKMVQDDNQHRAEMLEDDVMADLLREEKP